MGIINPASGSLNFVRGSSADIASEKQRQPPSQSPDAGELWPEKCLQMWFYLYGHRKDQPTKTQYLPCGGKRREGSSDGGNRMAISTQQDVLASMSDIRGDA